jgi:Matrixin
MGVDRDARGARLFAGAIFCLVLGVPSTAHAFEIKTTTSGAPIVWAPPTVPFLTDPSVEGLAPGAEAAIGTAIEGWSGQDGAPVLSVTPASAPSKPAVDGTNVVYYAPNGYPLAGSALAITILSYDDTTGYIVDADIVINGDYAFGILPEDSVPLPGAPTVANDADESVGDLHSAALGKFDIAHVVAHETGHSLGMSDETASPTPLMFLYSQPGDASHRTPTSDDLRGIADLYATVSGQHGCSSSTLSARHPRPSAWVWAATAIALALLVVRARRRASWLSVCGVGFAAALVVPLPRLESTHAVGDARARVTAVRAVEADGPWQTEVSLSVVECRIAACPSDATVTVAGGHRGHIVQESGDARAPELGDEIEIVIPKDRETRILRAPTP